MIPTLAARELVKPEAVLAGPKSRIRFQYASTVGTTGSGPPVIDVANEALPRPMA